MKENDLQATCFLHGGVPNDDKNGINIDIFSNGIGMFKYYNFF